MGGGYHIYIYICIVTTLISILLAVQHTTFIQVFFTY